MDLINKKLETEEFEDHKKLYGKLSILSVLTQHIAIGTILPLGSTAIYLLSYLSYENENISPSYLYFFTPFITFGGATFSFLSGLLNRKYGPKITILIGNTILMLNGIFLYFINKVFMCFFLFFFYGISFGISMKIAGVNMVKYYFENKGFVMGLTGSINNILSSFIISFAEKIVINPNSINLKGERFYPKEIGINYYKFGLYSVIICGIFTIITLLLLKPYPKDLEKKDNLKFNPNDKEENEKIIPLEEEKILLETSNDLSYLEGSFIGAEINLEYNNNNDKNNEEDDKKSMKIYSQIKKATSSFKFWRLFLINITHGPMQMLLRTTLRNIGTVDIYQNSITTNLIQNVIQINPIITAILNPIIGFLSDKFKFKYFLFFVNISYCVFGSLYPFILQKQILVYFFLLFFNIPAALSLTTTPPHIMKVFGMKHYIEVSGVFGFSIIIITTVSSAFAYIIESFFKNNMEFGYKIMFVTAGILSFVSLILGLQEEDTPFDYQS